MAQYTGINLSGSSPQELTDAIIAMNRSMEYQMANLDSDNVREIGGWSVGNTELQSTDFNVGMSSVGFVRFWAGGAKETAPFRVNADGSIAITNATSGRRIEMDYDSFRSYDASGFKRVAIENSDPSWGNHNIVWYDETGGYAGSIAGLAKSLLIGSGTGGEVVFSSPGGVRLATGTGAFDFNNVQILNFSSVAKFG